MNPTITILCVEDHHIVREAVGLLINSQPDMRVVASASTGEEAVELFKQHQPDVTLMDLRLPRTQLDGLGAIIAIRANNPAARVIVLTMYDGEEDIYRALQAGAATYLLKDTLPDRLIDAIRDVHAGRRPINPIVETRLVERASHPALTSREIEVVEHVSRGLRNREIAALLGISEETVHVHMRNIYFKLNVNDRTSMLDVAVRRGLVHW